MEDVLYYVFVLMVFHFLLASSLHGSEFLCRDPDTGKLHAVNSTWSSTTFCGNYTCRIRKKNWNETEYAPLRQMNINNIDIDRNSIEKRAKNEFFTETLSELGLGYRKEEKLQRNGKQSYGDDRYLTEDEIRTITQVLHLVKKSDIDALVEIYKLAQDIYKEIDSGSKEKSDDTIVENTVNEHLSRPKIDSILSKPYSYWYDPINKLVIASNKEEDMEKQDSNTMPSVVKNSKPVTNFRGPLLSSDFKRISYYPVSDFQRSSSYTRPTSVPINYQTLPSQTKKEKPDKRSDAQKATHNKIKPSIFLPYPFSYIQHYNNTYSDLYSKYNFGNYAFYTKSSNVNPYIGHYYSQIPANAVLINPYLTYGIDHIAKNIKENDTKVKENMVSNNRKENAQVPAWQTPSLRNDIIEDIRAHVQDKTKLLKPWRKNIKLERVGNVIQLEKIMRSKRETYEVISPITPMEGNHTEPIPAILPVAVQTSAQEEKDSVTDNSLFELVIEKTICRANDTTPGYFRHGNSSQPFPDCCPQRINNR